MYSPERFSEALLTPIKPHYGLQPLKQCDIEFSQRLVYPSEWSLRVFVPRAGDLIREQLNNDWSAYKRAVDDVGGLTEDQSFIGGYPVWDQEHQSYAPLEPFATIASERQAGLDFGDCGHANLFIRSDGSDVPLMIVQFA